MNDQDELPSADELAREKAAIELDKQRAEYEEWKSAEAQQLREAERLKALSIAQKEAAEARAALTADLLPDLSAVKESSLTVQGSEPLLGSLAAGNALQSAAQQVANAVKEKLGDNYRVLVTADASLIDSDAIRFRVKQGLEQLIEAATKVLEEQAEAADGVTTESVEPVSAAVALGAAKEILGAIPGVLSLLSSKRSVATAVLTADDTTAAIAVAGALARSDAGALVVHDAIRTLPPGGELSELMGAIRSKRIALAARKAELEANVGRVDGTARISQVTALIQATDALLLAVETVPSGQVRSDLVTAHMREVLSKDAFPVLVVKAQAGSSAQLTDDRPLWFQDKFSSLASMGIAYLLIDPAVAHGSPGFSGGRVVTGGVATAAYAVSGKLGGTFTVSKVGAVG